MCLMPKVQREDLRLFFVQCFPELRYSIITVWLNQYRWMFHSRLVGSGFPRLSFVLNWLIFENEVFGCLYWTILTIALWVPCRNCLQ